MNKAIYQMLIPCALAEWQEEHMQTLHVHAHTHFAVIYVIAIA